MKQTIQLEGAMDEIALQGCRALHPFKTALARSGQYIQRAFKRREYIPLRNGILWRIEDECWDLHRVMLSHIHQMQELLRVRHGQIQQRLLQFLDWLANKFGFRTEQGLLIPLRLTHQDLADVLGTTRVTVTRILQQLQQQRIISQGKHQILLHDYR